MKTPASWIENDPRDSCAVIQLLCERGVDFETSSYARCHAYLSGESTYTLADVDVPAGCEYKCNEINSEEVQERRRRHTYETTENRVPVSLADCQWVLDSMQVERRSDNRGTGVKIAILRGGIDVRHEGMPSLERISRACDATTDNEVQDIQNSEIWSAPEMVIDCATDITTEELKRVISPNTRDAKSTSIVSSIFGPRTESGIEGLVPDADLLYYKIFNENSYTLGDWMYNAMIDAVDNGADVVLWNTDLGSSCDEDYILTPFEPSTKAPLPYWTNFTAEQNVSWPTEPLLSDISEFESKSQMEQDALVANLTEAMATYNVKWAKEIAQYEKEKAAFITIAREQESALFDDMFQYAYDRNVFIIASVADSIASSEARGQTDYIDRYSNLERTLKPYLVGTVDSTSRRVPSMPNGIGTGGVDAVAPGGDLFFGGVAPPDLQPVLAVIAATTCQYRTMWISTNSTVQDKPNFYDTNFGLPYSLAHGTAVAAVAVQAIRERGEAVTISDVDEELKKYMVQPTWCEADGNCEEYGNGILTMHLQE